MLHSPFTPERDFYEPVAQPVEYGVGPGTVYATEQATPDVWHGVAEHIARVSRAALALGCRAVGAVKSWAAQPEATTEIDNGLELIVTAEELKEPAAEVAPGPYETVTIGRHRKGGSATIRVTDRQPVTVPTVNLDGSPKGAEQPAQLTAETPPIKDQTIPYGDYGPGRYDFARQTAANLTVVDVLGGPNPARAMPTTSYGRYEHRLRTGLLPKSLQQQEVERRQAMVDRLAAIRAEQAVREEAAEQARVARVTEKLAARRAAGEPFDLVLAGRS
jgi:hypothetical protein